MIRYFSVLVVLISVLLASCRSTPTPDLEATIQAGVAATQAAQPTNTLTPEPRDTPTPEPTDTPTAEPTDTPAPTSTARPTETPMPTDTSEPTQAPEPTEAPSSDYSLSVVGVEDPATPRPRHEPKEGTKALAVEVILGNVSGDTHRVNPLNGTLVDQDGFSYYPELAAREGGYIDGIDLAPGEKVRGWIPFEVPVGTVASYIKYQFSGYPDITLIASVDSESLKAPEPTPTKPPPPRTSTPIPLSRDDDFGVQKQVGSWGMKLYDVKRAKAVYRSDDAEVAQGVWLLSFVEFMNMGTGTNSPWNDLDFYLFDDRGWSYDAGWNKASSKAGWQFQAADIMDDINPGLMLGVVLAVDVPEDMGDVWLRVEQDPGSAIYLGNASSIPLE